MRFLTTTNRSLYGHFVHFSKATTAHSFLCRLRSIATHRDHFVRHPSVCPSVTLSKAMFRRQHMHSSECCHYLYCMLLMVKCDLFLCIYFRESWQQSFSCDQAWRPSWLLWKRNGDSREHYVAGSCNHTICRSYLHIACSQKTASVSMTSLVSLAS